MQELSSMNAKLEEKDSHIRELGETIEVRSFLQTYRNKSNQKFRALNSSARAVITVEVYWD